MTGSDGRGRRFMGVRCFMEPFSSSAAAGCGRALTAGFSGFGRES